jgi:hypothetical protein
MSEQCGQMRYWAPPQSRCILDAGHSGECKPADVALAEALESVLRWATPEYAGHQPSYDRACALLARVRGER